MAKARQALTIIVNAITAVVVATAVFLALANFGVISRPATETVTVGG